MLTAAPVSGKVVEQSPDASRDANLPAGGDAAPGGPQESTLSGTVATDQEVEQAADAAVNPSVEPQGSAFAGQHDPSDAAPLVLQSKAELREILRRAGLSRAAADKVAHAGWSALSGETEGDGEAELLAELRSIRDSISQKRGFR